MKLLLIAALCVCAVSAAPVEEDSKSVVKVIAGDAEVEKVVLKKKKFVPITRFLLSEDEAGNFDLDAETGDGIKTLETGTVKEIPSKIDEIKGSVTVVVMSGSYSYVGDDGKTYTVNWVADENGYRATADHLPVPPPIPEEIKKALSE